MILVAECACHAATNMSRIAKLMPPCVAFACVKWMLNAWCTGGRFQDDPEDCCFCGAEGCDRLRHYYVCPKRFGSPDLDECAVLICHPSTVVRSLEEPWRARLA